ncbi:MAG: hypothetical protein ABI467_04875 [Kofleriaceae bacterium]
MVRLKSYEVFTPSGYPPHTYVRRDERHQERLLEDWAQQATQIASVTGPSKAGKTVLVQRVIGEDNLVKVSGATVRTADQLWERVLDWYGEPHATVASTVTTHTDTASREHAGQIGISGTTGSHRRNKGEIDAEARTIQATVNRRGMPQVVAEIANTKTTILLDDFHYVPAAIQSDVAQQLKDAASRGVRICVASVPHRADDVVRALPELRGRVLSIDLDYWSRKDLLEIPRLGLPLLRLEIDHSSLAMFAIEAAGSPQLMQMICQQTSNHLGVRETGEPKAVSLDETARKEILFLSSCVVDFRSLVRALISGPKVKTGERRNYIHHDGRTGDVYLTIMRAIAMDPPKLAISYAELQERLDKMTQGASPDGASIVNACTRISQIAQGFAPAGGPALEWDEHAQSLVIHDPYLLFYLRWSVILEREADALG